MKITKVMLVCAVIASGLFFTSCVSARVRVLPHDAASGVHITGTATTTFSKVQFLHIPNNEKVGEMAYRRLLRQARRTYGRHVDIVNITAQGKFHWGNIAFVYPLPIIGVMNMQSVHATGQIIMINPDGTSNPVTQESVRTSAPARSRYASSMRTTAAANISKLDNAVAAIGRAIISKLPQDATIAVLDISSDNSEMSLRARDELEYQLVNSDKFIIVDRKKLDDIRGEQILQMSGEVSDESAVRIGNLIGAGIVLTGQITASDGSASMRLSVKALDVKTGRILSMERADF